MIPVTQFIKLCPQPQTPWPEPIIYEGNPLYHDENIHPTLVGLAVDYLSRAIADKNVRSAFDISLRGAKVMRETARARALLKEVRRIDDDSIRASIELVAYDSAYRAGSQTYRRPNIPDQETLDNIKEMLYRTQAFFKAYGPVVSYGLSFPPTGTFGVFGDCDFITGNTLWDFKVSKYPPTQLHMAQLVVYYNLGRVHHPHFRDLKYLGIFNPRLNAVYQVPIYDIPWKEYVL